MRRFIEYLYFRFCKPDIVRATRILLHGLQPELDINLLTKEKRAAFLGDCRELLHSQVLQQLLANMIHKQVDFAINRSRDWEENLFARATINGISLVKENLQIYASAYESENAIEEKLDQYAIL